MKRSAKTAMGVAALLLLLAGLGLPNLVVDGTRVFALPDGHALPELSDAVDAATGGDDLLAVVVVDDSGDDVGLLDEAGVAVIEEIRSVMEGLAAFDGVRAVTSAPLLADVEGAITAVRPLVPPPSDAGGWEAARRAVLADPFARDLLISADGRTALVAGWLFRGTGEEALVRQATLALRDPEFRSSEAGAALQEQVNGARLAVALGEARGPVDAEVGRRLAELAEYGGPGAGEVEAWRRAAFKDPASRAMATMGPILSDLDLPDGHRVGLAGVAVLEAALIEAVPLGVRLGLAGLVLMAGIVGFAGRRSLWDGGLAAVGTAGTFGVALGFYGLLGIPLHTLSALAALVGGAWAGGLLAARSHGRLPASDAAILCAALAAVPAAVGLTIPDAGPAPVIALAVASLIGLGAPVGDPAGVVRISTVAGEAPRWWSTQLAAALLVAGLAGSWGLAVGVDAAGLVSAGHPAGMATVDLALGLGVAPSAFAVYRDGDQGRALARPAALSGLRLIQDALEADPAVAGTRSWADFVSALHVQVSGAPAGSLPSELALVEQYLLMFGQDDEARTLVSDDLGLGVAFIRLAPGGGAHLGRLAELWPAEGRPVGLAGDGVQVALAARLVAQRILRAGAVCLALALVLVIVGAAGRGLGGRRAISDLLMVSAATVVTLAVASRLTGAVAPACCLAALAVLAASTLATLLPRRQATALLLVVGLGSALMLPSPALELRAFAAGLLAGCGGAVAVRLSFARASP